MLIQKTPFYFCAQNFNTRSLIHSKQSLKFKTKSFRGVVKRTLWTQTCSYRRTLRYPYNEPCCQLTEQLQQYDLFVKEQHNQRRNWGFMPSIPGEIGFVQKQAGDQMRNELKYLLTGSFEHYVQSVQQAIVNTKKAHTIHVTCCLPSRLIGMPLKNKVSHFKTHFEEICLCSKPAFGAKSVHQDYFAGCARIETIFKVGAELAVSENFALSNAFARLFMLFLTREDHLLFMIYPNLMHYGNPLRSDEPANHNLLMLRSTQYVQAAQAWQLGLQSHAETMLAHAPSTKFVSASRAHSMMKNEIESFANYVRMVKQICRETKVDPKGFMDVPWYAYDLAYQNSPCRYV